MLGGWVLWKEDRNGPSADKDGFANAAVFLKQRAEVRCGGGIEERDLGQGDFFEALVHERLRDSVAVAFEHGGEKEDGAGAFALERFLAHHCDGNEMRFA